MRWLDSITESMEFEQALGDGEGQGSLACCSPWGCKVRHDLVTEQKKNTEKKFNYQNKKCFHTS